MRNFGLLVVAAASLTACATPKYEVSRQVATSTGSAPRPGSTIGRDGKPLRGTEKPYQIKGIWYYPQQDPNYNEKGIGSWYGEQFHNRRTANGEVFDMDVPSAAHKTLPLPSLVEVTNLDNGRKMILRVNDRGPFVGDRIIDLSKAAADQLGYRRQGIANVRVRYVGPASRSAFDSRQYAQASSPQPPPKPAPRREFRDDEPVSWPSEPAPVPVQIIPSRTPVAQPPAPMPTAAAGAFRIQAGAFSSRENAERAVAQLAGAGRAVIEPMERASGTLYRVTVSAGDDEAMAWSVRDRVVSLGYSGATLLRP